MATKRSRLDSLLDEFAALQREYGRIQTFMQLCPLNTNHHKTKLAAIKRRLKGARYNVKLYVKSYKGRFGQ